MDHALLKNASCWFPVTDRVPKDPQATEWKQRARYRQALWREARGYGIGTQPYGGGEHATLNGSRLPLKFAVESGANFLTPGALRSARDRCANAEPHQMLRKDRLWADLLSSMPMCFNLFGDLYADQLRASTAVAALWPGVPCGRRHIRFEHSPGRCDPAFLGNKSAFDVAIETDCGDGRFAVIGIETKYHEHAQREAKTCGPRAAPVRGGHDAIGNFLARMESPADRQRSTANMA